MVSLVTLGKATEWTLSGLVLSFVVDWTVSNEQFQSTLFLYSSLSIQTLTLSIPLDCSLFVLGLIPLVTSASWHPTPPHLPNINKCYCFFSLPYWSIYPYTFGVVPQRACLITINKRSLTRAELMTSDDVCTVMEPKMWIGGEEGKYTKLFAGL